MIPLITGGVSYDCLAFGPAITGTFLDTDTIPTSAFTYDPYGGLSFFPFGLLDTHFSERSRQGRMICLGAAQGVAVGYGIDQNTALVVTFSNNDPTTARMTVLGQAGVTIFHLDRGVSYEAAYSKNGKPLFPINVFNYFGTYISYLTQGDVYLPATRTCSILNTKKRISPSQNPYPPAPSYGNIFDTLVWKNVAVNLVHSNGNETYATTYESKPKFGVHMKVVPGLTDAYVGKGLSSSSYNLLFTSYINMVVDIFPYWEALLNDS